MNYSRMLVVLIGIGILLSLQSAPDARTPGKAGSTNAPAPLAQLAGDSPGDSPSDAKPFHQAQDPFAVQPIQMTAGIGFPPLAVLHPGSPSIQINAAPNRGSDSWTAAPLKSRDQEIIRSISTSEWLGPLAPIAISPFFGITCLAGMSQFGGDYLPVNGFISNNPALRSPAVFWIFLILTLVTSLPRLTKISKPAAQALDQVEAYAGIITILVLRFMVLPPEPEDQVAYVQMGFLSFSADVLLSIAAIINIIVINSIKFFVEILVWLIPIPLVDATLEAGNKVVCASLMAIYAWSPLVATLINLTLFLVCFIIFNWVRRRVTFFRTMLTDPLRSLIQSSYGVHDGQGLDVFAKHGFGPFPAYASLRLEKSDSGWRLTQHRLILADRILDIDQKAATLDLTPGLLFNSILIQLTSTAKASEDSVASSEQVSQRDSFELYLSRRFQSSLPEIAEALQIHPAPHQAAAVAESMG